MSRSQTVRTKVFQALTGFEHSGKAIPVFDEIVNNLVPVPSVDGAEEVYIVLQDQQEYPNAVQTVCAPRFNLNLTIRVVTKWGKTGSKKLCEDIAQRILNLIRDDRGNSLIEGYQRVELSMNRTISEITDSNIAFSNITILNFIQNG